MIVNAPWAFTATWTIIKGFIDEKTRAKVMLYGSSYKKELDKFVANDQLPEFLGGTNNGRLMDNLGPWNDFEVVDGYKKGDIVGIRRKADGPGGRIFTPQDLEKLPNMLIQLSLIHI